MNRQEAKELLPIIQAFAEGRPIEYQDSYEKWVESDIMAFDLSPENYRIKREPKYLLDRKASRELTMLYKRRMEEEKSKREFVPYRTYFRCSRF